MRCVRGDLSCVGLAAVDWPNPRASTSRQFSERSGCFQRPKTAPPFHFARSNSTMNRAKKGRADHEVRRAGGVSWL